MKLIDLSCPVRNSIFIYLIFIIIYLVFFEKVYKDKLSDKKYILPVITITLSVVIFFTFTLLRYNSM